MASFFARFRTNGFSRTVVQIVTTVLIFAFLFGYGITERDNAAVMTAATGESRKLPILMYHSLLKDASKQGKYVLNPSTFESDMKYLKEHGFETVVVSDLIDFVENDVPLPEKPIMITFDDGCYNNYVYAYPVLKELGMKAVISIIGSQTALYTESGQENAYWSHLTLERLHEMEDVFEVQNHSWNLHTVKGRRGCLRKKGECADDYHTFFVEDTLKTQRMLIEDGIKTPTCYTYPYGARNDETEELVRELGFLCTLGCREGINTITQSQESLFELKRFNRPSGISTAQFMNKVGI